MQQSIWRTYIVQSSWNVIFGVVEMKNEKGKSNLGFYGSHVAAVKKIYSKEYISRKRNSHCGGYEGWLKYRKSYMQNANGDGPVTASLGMYRRVWEQNDDKITE